MRKILLIVFLIPTLYGIYILAAFAKFYWIDIIGRYECAVGSAHWTAKLVSNVPDGTKIRSIQYLDDKVIIEFSAIDQNAYKKFDDYVLEYSQQELGLMKAETFGGEKPDIYTIDVGDHIFSRKTTPSK